MFKLGYEKCMDFIFDESKQNYDMKNIVLKEDIEKITKIISTQITSVLKVFNIKENKKDLNVTLVNYAVKLDEENIILINIGIVDNTDKIFEDLDIKKLATNVIYSNCTGVNYKEITYLVFNDGEHDADYQANALLKIYQDLMNITLYDNIALDEINPIKELFNLMMIYLSREGFYLVNNKLTENSTEDDLIKVMDDIFPKDTFSDLWFNGSHGKDFRTELYAFIMNITNEKYDSELIKNNIKDLILNGGIYDLDPNIYSNILVFLVIGDMILG